MEPVKQLAEDKADAAAKELADAQRRLDEQGRRLEQLHEFRGQYQQQRTRSGESGIDGFRLRDYNAFVSRIDEAVAQQQREIAQLEAEVERKRRQWTELLSRARAIDKVVGRYADDERRDEDRRAQRQADAVSQARYRLLGRDE
jgi:flagellar FliJ protein